MTDRRTLIAAVGAALFLAAASVGARQPAKSPGAPRALPAETRPSKGDFDAIHVRKASSYYESLVEISEHLMREGEPPANLVLVSDALEDEDMMEMLNAGLLETIVVDDWKARIWAQVLPNIWVNDGAVVPCRPLAVSVQVLSGSSSIGCQRAH